MDDEHGQKRESLDEQIYPKYIAAFNLISKDSNHFLMVVEQYNQIVATCYLTLLPSLSYMGTTRLQIENVIVSSKHRGQQIGQLMIQAAINYGKEHGAAIIQLTSNKTRTKSIKFYENIGFEASHQGIKLHLI